MTDQMPPDGTPPSTAITYICYKPDGKIVSWGAAPINANESELALNGTQALVTPLDDLDTPWGDTHRVVFEPIIALTARPVLSFDKTEILADGLDAAVMTGLPDPCTILVDGEEHEIVGGTIELTTTMPATYHIVIEDPFPAQPFEGEVVAHAP